jgi:hypothetical protein
MYYIHDKATKEKTGATRAQWHDLVWEINTSISVVTLELGYKIREQ